ncbi:hypothetical protein NI470_04050 [Acinetobacter lwoffii]|uniref:hypothetical protein n=1 Tax=Acinetobacter lwoffii TaxID=28090 RepID=UPI00209B04B9|nr:hypothetical protein [Acinetobacter lwoffii]MCO8072808.1 hypothetical protein [Acinetobacter lwoffii]MCO8075786.1 hypothetical protein [Acinetobacter lwoffii]
MNALEKAHLIKELHGLAQQLEHKVLPLYEIARSKKRIRDIFNLCDEPIFKTQISAFKARTQPELVAYQFSADTSYHLSFRGYFTEILALEQALSAHPDSGWAVLHHPERGWQIWLIPIPQSPSLHSQWAELQHCYIWLLQQQQRFSCLQQDPPLIVPALSLNEAEISLKAVETTKYHRGRPRARIHALELHRSDELPIQVPTVLEPPDPQLKTETTIQQEQITVSELIQFPAQIQLGELNVHVHPLGLEETNIQRLCALELGHNIEHPAYLDIALYYAAEDNWQARQVYLVEQLNLQGQFVKYLMLLGVPSQLQAHYCIQHWLTHHQRQAAAIKSLAWSVISTSFMQLELFSTAYLQQAETVWTQPDYHPFIPAQSIQKQKFISFQEAAADFSTPVLLLQEHQKIRVIHGEKRISLAEDELAYPYILLQRDKQLNWQNIHNIILTMPQPIRVLELYREIQAQMIE